jgi:hypothetical protein
MPKSHVEPLYVSFLSKWVTERDHGVFVWRLKHLKVKSENEELSKCLNYLRVD